MTSAPTSATSRIGLGLAAVARPAYITPSRSADLGASAGERAVERLRALSHELLDVAHAAGVRYVDVARSYGLAEDFLSSWLAARPSAEGVVVGSKWGYRYVGDWQLDAGVHEVKDHSLEAFRDQYPQSRELLGTSLAIYHIHSLTPDSPALTTGRCTKRWPGCGLRAPGSGSPRRGRVRAR